MHDLARDAINSRIVPVILSGGVGSRLWPLSRANFPKPFNDVLQQGVSLFQATAARVTGIAEKPIIVCGEQHRFLAADQLNTISITPEALILEPEGKNTAVAIALAAFYACKVLNNPLLLVMPADHFINNDNLFCETVIAGCQLARENHLVTFGCVPTEPVTEYGYIKTGAQIGAVGYQVDRFVEKPTRLKAQEFLQSSDYYWNSGIFLFNAECYLQELKLHHPVMWQHCQLMAKSWRQEGNFIHVSKDNNFYNCPEESIDYAVMEKTTRAAVLPLRSGWSDVGSWSAFFDANDQDDNGNVLKGDVFAHEVTNSLLHSEDKLLVGVGLDNCIVVSTSDAVVVANKDSAAQIKQVVQQLKAKKRVEVDQHRKVYRPWGSYEILIDTPNYKVKHILVKVSASLSLQLHQHRSEHWVIVSGTAEVTCGEEVLTLLPNQSTYIPPLTRHRLRNSGLIPLEIIEVQLGSYLGEDDIIRFDDQYGRKATIDDLVTI